MGESKGGWLARSRSRREKPSKCRGPCIQAVHDEPTVECRGVHRADRRSSIHTDVNADARERGVGEGEESKGVSGARRGRLADALFSDRSRCAWISETMIMGEYLIGGARRRD